MKVSSLHDVPAARAYLERIGAEVRSMRVGVVREQRGSYWKDLALIRFEKDGTVDAPDGYEPTDLEAAAIVDAFKTVEWPKHIHVKDPDPPEEIKNAEPALVYEFRGADGMFIMYQLRRDGKGAGKAYTPFTFWDDGQWRKLDPEGALPLWGMDKIGNHTTVFLHEGAKAARHCHEMVNGRTKELKERLAAHPWGLELSTGAHLGWIGGALNPGRTDWKALREAGIKRAYIVSDNDGPGLTAVPRIAFQLNCPTFQVQFTDEFPGAFDLADEFPKEMFSKIEGKLHYVGPSFRSCLHPATWATDSNTPPKGKPITTLRQHFKEMWAYIEEADLFVCIDMPEIMRTEAVFNKMLSAFSHVAETSKPLLRAYNGRATKLCYRPDNHGRIVTDKTTSAINLHTPTTVRPQRGDPKPFTNFLNYLVPDERERKELMRWCATLIARPDLRMEYGLLMVTEHQGIGKTTLGSTILAPLVGAQNVGYPTETNITQSDFNEWLANKRLVIVNEIYSGHSWKAYNSLKSYITDREVTVNAKYQRPYTIENWAHIYACSNSLKALRMEEDDRRWFYPELTEKAWKRDRFTELHNWIKSGGLSIISWWAHEFGNYVMPGERAPMTKRKQEMIEESLSPAQREVAALAQSLVESETPTALVMKEIAAWAQSVVHGRVYDSDHELRKVMKSQGAVLYNERMKAKGRLQFVIMNPALVDALQRMGEATESDRRAAIVKALKSPSDLLGQAM